MAHRLVGGSAGRIGTERWLRRWPLLFLVAVAGTLAATPASASTVGITISADPTESKPVVVTVTGWSSAPRRLSVYLREWGACEPSPGGSSTRRLPTSASEDVDGAFTASYTFNADRAFDYRICAYVTTLNGLTVDASASETVTPRAAHATLEVSMGTVSAPGQAIPVTVTGWTEAARLLSVYWTESSGCPASPLGASGLNRLRSSVAESVDGPFSRSYAFTPDRHLTYRVCAYVATQFATIDASATATSTIERPVPPSPAPDPATLPPALLAPDNGISGTILNPTFSWASGPHADMLVISRRVGSQLRPLLATGNGKIAWLDGTKPQTQEAVRAQLVRSRYATDTLASFSDTGGSVNVRLHEPLEPGVYAWQVFADGFRRNQAERRPSEVREFTVIGPKLERLSVRTRSRAGASTTNPGETRIDIAVTHFSTVRVELRRAGRRLVRTVGVGNNTKVWLPVSWSCKKPGGRYRYRVEAWDTHGTLKATSGSFRPVSAARCRAMRNRERRAEAARQREVQRRAAKRRRAEAAAQRQRTDRFKSNCGKLGGSPRLMRSGEGDYWVCVAPGGGALMYVPY